MANMSPRRWTQAVEEHEEILEALGARDGRRLGKILKKHPANKFETVKEALAAQGAGAE
jgi:DNA-binding GntR family transcriptional regulator